LWVAISLGLIGFAAVIPNYVDFSRSTSHGYVRSDVAVGFVADALLGAGLLFLLGLVPAVIRAVIRR
jgi:hypothetical protein